jgi:hypothetical protein
MFLHTGNGIGCTSIRIHRTAVFRHGMVLLHHLEPFFQNHYLHTSLLNVDLQLCDQFRRLLVHPPCATASFFGLAQPTSANVGPTSTNFGPLLHLVALELHRFVDLQVVVLIWVIRIFFIAESPGLRFDNRSLGMG